MYMSIGVLKINENFNVKGEIIIVSIFPNKIIY